ncbi:glutamate synthase-related protein [Parafilimonas terrae]|nr:glutamate synthase-related protein [Parafilimonas terrae]
MFLFKNADESRQLKPGNNNPDSNKSLFFSGNNNYEEPTVLFGNSFCTQPYLSGIVCNETIHAKQSPVHAHEKAEVLNRHYSSHQLNAGFAKDIIWQIVPGYPGCSNSNSNFNPEMFSANAMQPFVKMIELKLASFSSAKNNFTNQAAGSSVAMHTAFSTAEGMAMFIDSLRQLSGGKPVGVRLFVTSKKVVHEICYAFRKTGIIPDYIVIEGCDNEDNSSPDSSKSASMPLYEALLFVSKTLEMYGLEKEIKIIAAAYINTAFDVLKLYALGADALRVKSPADSRQAGAAPLVRMQNADSKIIRSTMEIMRTFGYVNMKQITLPSLLRKLDSLQLKTINKKQHGIYPRLKISHLFMSFLVFNILACVCCFS